MWKVVQKISIVVFFLGLGGIGVACEVTECPTGQVRSDGACVHNVLADGKWNSIKQGELEVRVPKESNTSPHRLAFWFVRDPAERMEPNSSKRVGRWKLLLRDYEPGEANKTLSISWKLRDMPASLSKGETVRLLAIRPGDSLPQARAFPGHYEPLTGRVQITLHQRFSYRGLYLIPMRTSHVQISRR